MCDAKVSRSRPDTSSSYLRKIKKPLIERKRRERINTCLDQLKAILLENIKRNGGTQVSKLDKADILEMTVSHLRQIQQQQITVAMATSAAVVKQYNDGFSDCANETVRYMETSKTYPSEMIGRVRSHLSYSTAHAPATDRPESKLYFGSTGSASPMRPEPQRMCKSVSPRNEYINYSQMYSTLLMPVPQVKYESLSDSEADYVSCDVKERSQNDTLSLPVNVQVPVSVNDSPSQKQVWRPF